MWCRDPARCPSSPTHARPRRLKPPPALTRLAKARECRPAAAARPHGHLAPAPAPAPAPRARSGPALAPALPSAAALQEVSFELCKLTEAGLQSLAEVLPQLPRLRGLSLFQNAIAQNGPGVAAVNDAVEDRAEALGYEVAEYDWNHEALFGPYE